MRVGFTGTRYGMTDAQARELREWIGRGGVASFHHGSCRGADVQAARIAKEFRAWVISYPGPDGDPCRDLSGVDDETRAPKTHFARNRDIVTETDILIACPREMEHQPRGGTWYTVDYARKVGKPVAVILPDGTIP